MRQNEGDGVRTYVLGPLNPQDRVEVSFVLQRSDRSAFPSWDQIFVAVEAAEGVVKAGDPGWVILVRMWYAIFSVF